MWGKGPAAMLGAKGGAGGGVEAWGGLAAKAKGKGLTAPSAAAAPVKKAPAKEAYKSKYQQQRDENVWEPRGGYLLPAAIEEAMPALTSLETEWDEAKLRKKIKDYFHKGAQS